MGVYFPKAAFLDNNHLYTTYRSIIQNVPQCQNFYKYFLKMGIN